MKILLDENLHRKLKFEFVDHEVYIVSEMHWLGKSNGELLKLMVNANFQVFITADKNLQFQQNLTKYPITIFLLNAYNNKYSTHKPLIPLVLEKLTEEMEPGLIEIREQKI